MRAEEYWVTAETLFVDSNEVELHDWSQTPLGAIETWSDDLKAAVQRHLTELAQAKLTTKTLRKFDLLQNGAASALPPVAQADAFRVRLMNVLRPLKDATEIQELGARILGEFLGASRVIYIEVVSDSEAAIVHRNYTNGVAPLSGYYRLEEYRRNLTADHWAGRTQIVTDILNNPEYTNAEKAKYREIDIAAHIDVPLIKNNQFVALLAVHHSTPRHWTQTEVKLVEETAEQTWAAVERARAQAAQRESEARLAADLVRMRRLYDLYATLATGVDLKTALDEILAVACEFTQTERGCVQLVSDDGKRLEMFNWRGYCDDSPFINHFRYEGFKEGCDRARVARQRFTIEETIGYPSLEGTEAGAATYAEGIRAAQSTPIVNRSGESIGVLSTQFSQPHRPSDDELQLIDLLAWTAADFVERYRAHMALRESEEKYRSLFESIDEAYAVVEVMADDNGKWNDFLFLEVNPAFVKQTGMEYPVGRKATELLGTPNPRWAEVYGRVAETGEPIRLEESEFTLGRVFDLYVFRLGGDGSRRVAALFTNITERKQVEAAIAADLRDTQLLHDLSARLVSEGDIQTLYQEIVSAAITLTQADAGSIQAIDESTQELVLIATQGIDRTVTDRFQRVTATSITSCGMVLARGKRAFVDFDVLESEDPDGSLRLHRNTGLISAQSTPLISRSGKRMGIVSTHWHKHHRPSERELRFLDLLARQAADLIEQRQTIAEREQLLAREQAARAEADRANRIKDEFLAVLSHELRSPLNPILGWTRFLQSGKLDAVRQREALATIERNAKLQTQLIEDLLDISRIMQGKLSLSVAPVSLTFVTSAALETVRLAAEVKNIAIALDLDPEIAPVSGDAVRLQQVVWNLLSNAVKFTPNGGQVTVELRQLNRLAQIRVSDTGKGINQQFLPYVFEYFRQEDGSTTRKFGGLGLGLAIVRQIVELHGGTVRAESQGEGQGATFIVQLPTMQQTTSLASEHIQSQIDTGSPLAGIQILLVDDDPDTREFQEFLLKQSGARVIAVDSGLKALQALEQSIPDVLVSDIGMAEMDGYMLLQQIRSRPLNRGGMIPAIALTAYAAEIDRQQAIQVGFQTHLTKPVESEELVRAIAILLEHN